MPGLDGYSDVNASSEASLNGAATRIRVISRSPRARTEFASASRHSANHHGTLVEHVDGDHGMRWLKTGDAVALLGGL